MCGGGGARLSRLGWGRDVSLYKTYTGSGSLRTALRTPEPSLGSTKVVYLGWQRRILTEVRSLAWCVCICM